MVEFDYYAYGMAVPAFNPAVNVGTEAWMDGCDGFYDQYFEGKHVDVLIRFVAVPGTGISLAKTSVAFQQVPLIEARLLENQRACARVRIESRTELGLWAREQTITEATSLDQLTMLSADERKTVERVRDAALPNGESLWVSPATFWDYRRWFELTAAYAFVHRRELRCILLATNSTPSLLVRLA